MKVVFMGTPSFSVPTLEALIDAGHEVAAVFTQPDKPKGRGYKLLPTAVKEVALKHEIPVYQPKSLRVGEDAEESLKVLKEINPDVLVVVAYGQLLPESVLETPKLYPINVHASLLPKYRGAAPIQQSIIYGESVTGVTTMLMEKGLDTGPMFLKAETEIGEDETASELHDRLSVIGAELLIKTLAEIEKNDIKPELQDDRKSNYAGMITKEMCKIDFSKSAVEVHNLIRGLSAAPCAYAMLGEKRIKIFHSTILTNEIINFPAGTVVKGKTFTVVCGDRKAVTLTEVMLEGGKRMKGEAFLLGNHPEKLS